MADDHTCILAEKYKLEDCGLVLLLATLFTLLVLLESLVFLRGVYNSHGILCADKY